MDKPKHSCLPDSFLVVLAKRGKKPAEVTEPEDSQGIGYSTMHAQTYNQTRRTPIINSMGSINKTHSLIKI